MISRNRLLRLTTLVLAIAILLVRTGFARATLADMSQSPVGRDVGACATAPSPQPGAPLTADDLVRFFDGLVPYAFKEGDIAGGEVAVVCQGQLVFAKGYGYSNVADKTAVSPDSTLFRVGSVSKLFLWTAVMQLVEEGKLNLDSDVNGYLDFTIPAKFGKPITMRELMTHSAGFEQMLKDILFYRAQSVLPLREFLIRNMPGRIFPPGQVVAYSNYGGALAGYIVQRISGQPFAQYIAGHILLPLGMNHSTFLQPLPLNLRPYMSAGYWTASGGPQRFEMVGIPPVGALSSTAADMARFMIAQLQDGRLGDTSILSTATAKLMHAHDRSEAPGINGFALGFHEENRNGYRIIAHAGDTQFFHSDLLLVLKPQIGLYLVYNSRGTMADDSALRNALFAGFMNRYLPGPSTPNLMPHANFDRSADARLVSGTYVSSERQETSILRLAYTLLGQTHVSQVPDGSIAVSSLTGTSGKPYTWREIAPLVYQRVDGQSLLAFVRNPAGRIDHVAYSGDPESVLQPAPPSEGGWVLPMLALAFSVLLFAPVLAPVSWWIRRRYNRSLRLERRLAALRVLSILSCLVWIAVAVGWADLMAKLQHDLPALSDAIEPVIYTLSALGMAGLIGTVVTACAAMESWRSGAVSVVGRVGYTAIFVASAYVAWFVTAYHLASFANRF